MITRAQRAILGLYALYAGALGGLAIILPKLVAHETLGPGAVLTPLGILYLQLYAGARIGLALVALTCARTPRPPKLLVWSLAVALAVSVAGPVFSALVVNVGPLDVKPFGKWIAIDATFAIALVATQIARRFRE